MAEASDTPTEPTGASGADTPPPAGPWWRSRAGIIGIVAAVAILVIAGLAFAIGGGSDDTAGGTSTTTDRSGASGTSGSSGASGASGTTGKNGGKGGTGAKGGKGSTTTTTIPTSVPTVSIPEGDVDLAKIQVAITPGTCTWNADTLDLVAKGTIRNNNPVDAVVSVDVTFLDAGNGEVDTASDLAILSPGETASWDVLGASVDPPTGGLHCEVALS